MPTQVTIRTATISDCPAVCRLLRQLDDHHVSIRSDVFQPYDDPIQQRERVTRFVNGDDAVLFVAEIDCDIIGLATVRVSDNPDAPMFRPGRRACMDDLVVKQGFRGAGIAKRLLERISEWAQSRELSCLVTNVWNGNKAGVSFFTKTGFAPRCQQMELQIEKATRPIDAGETSAVSTLNGESTRRSPCSVTFGESRIECERRSEVV